MRLPDAIAIQADIRQLDQVQNLFQQTVNRFGKLDILVNNAAGKNIRRAVDYRTVDSGERWHRLKIA